MMTLLKSISLLVLVTFFLLPADAQEVGVPQSLTSTPLEIVTDEEVYTFEVEVARTQEEMAKGLMFRTEMPENHGMIFDYNPPRWASMWMKNTYIPLDILFIESDGTILNIVENTTPFSLVSISAIAPVRASLELNAGVVKTLGIEPGDMIRHELFGNASNGQD